MGASEGGSDSSESASTHPAAVRRSFLEQQVAPLEPFNAVLVSLGATPADGLRVERGEDDGLTVAVSNRSDPPLTDVQRAALRRLGFVADGAEWTARAVASSAAIAVDWVEAVLGEVFGAPGDATLNVRHESTREQREAAAKAAAMRAVIEPVLADIVGSSPARDADGDYVLDHASARVYVSPQALPGRRAIVGVFAITNVAVNPAAELGAYLAELNFRLLFGRFSLDVENRSVWLTENLLGEHLHPDDLRHIIAAVAETADFYDDRIAQRFGGTTAQGALAAASSSAATSKPGSSAGYL